MQNLKKKFEKYFFTTSLLLKVTLSFWKGIFVISMENRGTNCDPLKMSEMGFQLSHVDWVVNKLVKKSES